MGKKKKPTASTPRKRSASANSAQKDSAKKKPRQGKTNAKATPDSFPIVGVGASAGGLDALTRLFRSLPDEPRMAFVVIQHLDPTKESMTAELLAKHTRMHVTQVDDEPRILPNHIYVIPPNKYLSIVAGQLHLSPPEHRRGARVPIDYFFRSLAEQMQARSVAVVLSGTGTDGTLGIKAVKGVGGLVAVQDPATTEFSGMPDSAIATGVVDVILPPEEIAETLEYYAQHPYVHVTAAEDLKAGAGATEFEPVEQVGVELGQILALLRANKKHDFHCYKDGTLLRRTRRRMGLHRVAKLTDYLEFLRQHPDEIDALVKDMLISVTDFFRDPEAWQTLDESVIAPLVEAKSPNESIRVWVPGCATGEEPYSLGMMFLEQLQRVGKNCPLQIFASDIDRDALEYGRGGAYPDTIAADVSQQRLRRFFEKVPGNHHYRVNKTLRETVVFAEQNLISDPPFSRLDLICCRNVLIYLRPEIQQKLIALCHFSLIDTGHLFLGNSETVGRHEDLFQVVSQKWRIYRRVGPTQHARVEFPVAAGQRREIELPGAPPQRRDTRLAHIAQQRLLDWLSPQAVLVDRTWPIVYFCGDTDAYLTHSAGAATQDLLAKARQGLRTKLRGAVQKALDDDRPITVAARVKRDGSFRPVRITARPLKDAENEETLVLVVFEEAVDADGGGRKTKPRADGEEPSQRDTTEIDGEDVIRHLEEELQATREDLQTSVEQLEASNEEFKASNEEVMSINEELQSTNEELETSKEELQSLNEELNTVNNQLAFKVDELEGKNDDLHNLLTSTDIATIALDRDLHIKWFTPATQRLMNLQPTDLGRPLADFSHKFVSEDLRDNAQQVLQTLVPIETEVATTDGRFFLRRVIPYCTEDDRIDGVVITLVDISRRQQAEQSLRESEERYRLSAQSLEIQVAQRTEMLSILQDVTRAANEAQTVDAALRAALARISQHGSWQVGHAWHLADDGSDDMVSTGIWHINDGALPAIGKFEEFQQISAATRFAHGEFLIGAVAASGKPRWIDEIKDADKWRRGDPRKFDLRAVVAFPVFAHERVVAVLELFSSQAVPRNERFIELLPDMGMQLGHVIERKRLEKEIAEIADREQRRMGQEVHDGLSQQLAGITLLMQGLAEQLAEDGLPQAAQAERLREAVDDAARQCRDLTRGLLPVEIDPHGLMTALEEFMQRTHAMYDVDCRFECEHPVEVDDSFTATHLFRIATEAVHNAVKHANAENLSVCLSGNEQKTLVIADDGGGMSMVRQTAGDGLHIMQYRAGLISATLDIDSTPGQGTTVTCRFG